MCKLHQALPPGQDIIHSRRKKYGCSNISIYLIFSSHPVGRDPREFKPLLADHSIGTIWELSPEPEHRSSSLSKIASPQHRDTPLSSSLQYFLNISRVFFIFLCASAKPPLDNSPEIDSSPLCVCRTHWKAGRSGTEVSHRFAQALWEGVSSTQEGKKEALRVKQDLHRNNVWWEITLCLKQIF